MSEWQEKYSTLVEHKLAWEGGKEWQLRLEEDKKKGTLQVNARLFKVEGSYQGPTSNGMLVRVHDVASIRALQAALNTFFDSVVDTLG